MDQRRWHRLESLFHAAVVLPASERTAFVQAECQGDEMLQESLRQLLSNAGLPWSFLSVQAGGNGFTEPSAGQMVGHFELVRKLGEGGVGTVWLAWDKRLLRTVALKLLKVAAMDPEFTLMAEAQAASQLNHPNAVTVYEFGEWNGCPFIISEFVDGTTLRSRLKGTSLPVKEVFQIVAPCFRC